MPESSPDFQKIFLCSRVGHIKKIKCYWKNVDFEVARTRNCCGWPSSPCLPAVQWPPASLQGQLVLLNSDISGFQTFSLNWIFADLKQNVTTVLQPCYDHVTFMLQLCYNHVTTMLQPCYIHGTSMLHSCCNHVTTMLQPCYIYVTFMLHSFYIHVTTMLHSCYIHVTFMLHSCYIHVTIPCYIHVAIM